MSRQEIVDTMLAGATLGDQVSARIHNATAAFSVAQLERLQRVGIRFWQESGVPPPFDGWVQAPRMSTQGAYLPQIRTIKARPTATVSDLRHEIAHAWDHVRGGGVSGNPARMNRRQRERIVTRPSRMWSASDRKHRIGQARLTLTEMLESYRRRATTKESAFDNPATREGYSRADVYEFYAEGYSVLFGTSRDSQAKLWLRAEELFILLQREARAQGIETPSEATLQRHLQRLRTGHP